MNRMPRWVVLSPHLDDASLSIGGLIAAIRSSAQVEVWTLFCGATFQGPYSEIATWLHQSSGGSTGSRLSWRRQREDRSACRKLGARPRHYPFKDAAYRKTEDGGFMYRTAQPAQWHPQEARMINSVTKTLKRDLLESDIVISPLAIGRHVDHVITRHAAEQARIPNLMYYPDVPYNELFTEQVPAAIEGLASIAYTLTAEQIDDWISAVKCYTTQIPMLERAVGSLPPLIRDYAASSNLGLYSDPASPEIDLSGIGIFRQRKAQPTNIRPRATPGVLGNS